jgi:hypothetical protein
MEKLSVISALFKKLSDTINDVEFQNNYKINERFFTRQRKLSFKKVMLFILGLPQKSLPSSIEDFIINFSDTDRTSFTKQAFSFARQHVSYKSFEKLLEITVDFIESRTKIKNWNGYRILAIDGFVIQLPDTKENRSIYGVNVNSSAVKHKEVAMSKAGALFDITNDRILSARMDKRYKTERDQAINLMSNCNVDLFNEKTIILFDRGECS